MKAYRIIITVLTALICCQAFSQTKEDLVGTWLFTETDDSDGDLMEMKEYYEFNADGNNMPGILTEDTYIKQ